MKLKDFLKAGAAINLALAMTACGSMDTDEKGKKVEQNDVDLAGTWETDCYGGDFLGLSKSSAKVVFSAIGDFDRVSTLFSGDTCAEKALQLSVSGTYDVVGAAQGVEGGADNLNFTVSKATLTPFTDGAVTALNAANYCGVSNWSIGAAVEIAAKDCMGDTVTQGEVVLDIYRIEQEKRLLLGDSLLWFDKNKPTERPTALALDHVFHKR